MQYSKVLALVGAVLAIAGPALAETSPAQINDWLKESRAEVQRAVATSDTRAGALDLSFRVDGASGLGSATIVKSSGSTVADEAVLKAVRRVRVEPAPAELSGRTLVFSGLTTGGPLVADTGRGSVAR